MTDFLVYPVGRPWTVDDLRRLPDNGLRYEISDGRLIVAPPPASPHLRVVYRLRRLLDAQVPDSLVVVENAGVVMAGGRTYRVPDLCLLRREAIEVDTPAFHPDEVALAVEVLSPDSGGDDLITKRHQYGRAGIPHYWVVDQKQRLLRVLRHDGGEGYLDHATVAAGESWTTDEPFPLTLDPAGFV